MIITETALLKPIAQATVPAWTKPFDAAEYGPGSRVYVCESLLRRLGLIEDRLLQRLGLSTSRPKSILPAVLAPERSYVALAIKSGGVSHTDIRRELPFEHLSILEHLVGLCKLQRGGQPGLLLNDVHVTVAYLEDRKGKVFPAHINWHDGSWNFWDSKLDGKHAGGPYGAGIRVICPGQATL